MREEMIEAGLWSKDDPRDPSQSIGAAWEVVEKLKDAMSTIGMAGTFNMEFDLESRQWEVGYTDLDYDKGWCWEDGWPVMADTAPLAICRAALKANDAHPQQ